jgi:hypothetical protein
LSGQEVGVVNSNGCGWSKVGVFLQMMNDVMHALAQKMVVQAIRSKVNQAMA